ncbi:helix-turn-helix domain-containing protein [Paraglaciecola sp.]|uniref:AraC family transcriptional regulator n=1 Tax=Paraglaciecola sp. TaxID=1920173 RepID=UPI0030F3BBF8
MFFASSDIFDLFIRMLAMGQLSLLSIYLLSQQRTLKNFLGASLSLCLCTYLLLTAPIADEHYGIFRGLLLFFTEFTPYVLWCFAMTLLNDDFHPKTWPRWSAELVMLGLVWFLYFFAYLQGKGLFHQINHGMALCLLVHIIFVALRDLADDLDNVRRNIRKLLVLFTCLYFSSLLVLELGDASIRDAAIFSSINALLILLSTSGISYGLFNDKFEDETAKIADGTQVVSFAAEIPLVYQEAYQTLGQAMSDGIYKETQLSIKQLASKLAMPEHQLRELINKHMGFRNFSEFLNAYRLPAACAELQDITKLRKPILTIALDLGYGSIGTFNRAFKAKMNQTPKEYRSQIQK